MHISSGEQSWGDKHWSLVLAGYQLVSREREGIGLEGSNSCKEGEELGQAPTWGGAGSPPGLLPKD